MDNEIYGLTKGQPSPTSPHGIERKASPYGSAEYPINPILMALAYGASFVARGFSSRPRDVTELIKRGILHKGFAFIQIYSPCVTFYDTYDHFKEVTAELPANHDPSDKLGAMRLAMDDDKLYLGVFYKENRPSFVENLAGVRGKAATKPFNLEELINRYRS